MLRTGGGSVSPPVRRISSSHTFARLIPGRNQCIRNELVGEQVEMDDYEVDAFGVDFALRAAQR